LGENIGLLILENNRTNELTDLNNEKNKQYLLFVSRTILEK